VSLGSRACLLDKVSSGAATCPTAPSSAFLRGSSGIATCSMASSGLWTTRIKKGLAALGTQLGLCVFKAHSCITEAPADVQAATVRRYSVVSFQLTTFGHGYIGDMT
jgi:hypothetical protein